MVYYWRYIVVNFDLPTENMNQSNHITEFLSISAGILYKYVRTRFVSESKSLRASLEQFVSFKHDEILCEPTVNISYKMREKKSMKWEKNTDGELLLFKKGGRNKLMEGCHSSKKGGKK